jgi:rfaE bifunctional protein nucleotidyltransferase chain/domain/rfaE bifunctional protein kinase chain/domain
MTRLTVIGDALLDRDVFGSVDRLCPDAPAPVVEQRDVFERAGGAALAASLAARGGATVTLLAPIGDDPAGRRLIELLEDAGVSLIPWRDPVTTVEKQRVLVGQRPIVRLDRGGGSRTLPEPSRQSLRTLLASDAVLVSDYGNAASNSATVRAGIAAAVDHGIPVVWDPHRNGPAPVRGTTLVTPNATEVRHFDRSRHNELVSCRTELASLVAASRRLLAQWRTRGVCVTRGSDGAALVADDTLPLVVPVDAPEPNPIDTCGAGDAFAAHCALAFASGAIMSEAVQSAVQQAARFVAAGGALGLAPGLERGSPHPRPEPARSETLVATGGCFDLLHAGHVALLQRARQLGDRLVVLLNGDESVRRLKGRGRPLQAQADRAAVLRSLGCVDEVIVFDEDTPTAALRKLRPHIFVKGGDYSSTTLPEAATLEEWGGVVITVPYLAGRSTTGIVEHIEAANVG